MNLSIHRTQIVGLAVVLFAIYGQSLGFPFQFDDGHSIYQNPHIRSLENVPSFFSDPAKFSADASLMMYRPVVLSSYAINHALSQLAPWSYHLLNVVLHLLTAVTVGFLARRLLDSTAMGWVAAWLFAVHPIHSEAVYYVSSRSESMAVLGILVAMLLHLKGRANVESRRWLHLGAVLGFTAGLCAKSAAIVLLPILLVHDLMMARGSLRRRWREHAVFWGVGAVYLLQTRAIIAKATVAAPVRSYAEQWWTQAKALSYYLHLLIIPRELSVDHQFLISDSIFDPFAAAAAAVTLSLVAVALWFAVTGETPKSQKAVPTGTGRPKWALFLILWFLAALAPASLVPLNVLVNEHRLYLAGVAFALGLASLVRTDSRARRGVLLALPLMALLALQRGEVWASSEALWQDAARKGPGMARPFIMLGFEYQQQGDDVASIDAFEAALARDASFVAGYVALSEAHLRLGQTKKARSVAREATLAQPDSASVWSQLAQTERVVGMAATSVAARRRAFESSVTAFRQALRLTPDEADFHDNLGSMYQELDRAQEALPHHERAVRLRPERAISRLNYGNALFILKDYFAASQQYRRAVEIDPDFVDAWDNLAVALGLMGRSDEAAAAKRPSHLRRRGGR